MRWVALCCTFLSSISACTTFVAGRGATADGSVMSTHSNDGDGVTAGNLAIVTAADWELPCKRTVSGGSVPQVAHTKGYFTKVGGYASINEDQVGLAESTCVAVFPGNRSAAILNIVDLGALGLERARSAREAVQVMGSLAEVYGYYDSGESLLVSRCRWPFCLVSPGAVHRDHRLHWAGCMVPASCVRLVGITGFHSMVATDPNGR